MTNEETAEGIKALIERQWPGFFCSVRAHPGDDWAPPGAVIRLYAVSFVDIGPELLGQTNLVGALREEFLRCLDGMKASIEKNIAALG